MAPGRNHRRRTVLQTAMNARVKSAVVAGAALAALATAAAPATARIVEVGQVETQATPSCPSPCIAISRTTGYQAKVGPTRGLMTVPENGRIVAWTIGLGKPGAQQKRFFDNGFGGRASAGLTVLRPGRRLAARVVAHSPIMPLEGYFGQTVQFPLERSIPVRKGYVVALTVPTWAPALAVGLGGDTSWRASRPAEPRERCLDTETQTAQTRAGGITRFRCLYRTARLTYSATLISDPPAPTRPADDD